MLRSRSASARRRSGACGNAGTTSRCRRRGRSAGSAPSDATPTACWRRPRTRAAPRATRPDA